MTGRTGKLIRIAVAISIVALSWSTKLDAVATTSTEQALQRALIAFAAARALNSAISVAQGTEVALQPAGVGVTLSVGEALDPVNDLIERFSWIVLAASASLGAQILLVDIFSSLAFRVALSVVAGAYVVAVWMRPTWRWIDRVAVAALVVRFTVTCSLILAAFAGDAVIEARQAEGLAELSLAADRARDEPTPPNAGTGLADSIERFITGAREALDVDRHLAELERAAEQTIATLIDLIIVFSVQSIVLPLLSAAAVLFAVRQIWARLGR